jgi:repressor LexA
MTQETLAQELRTSKQVISRYEKGVRTPSIEIASRYAAFFGVSLDYLMGSTDRPEPNSQDPFAAIPGVRRGIENPGARPDGIKNILPIRKKSIPFLGEIAAGVPIFADEQRDVYLAAEADIHCDFALRVKGDSMTGASICDGDIVFIRAQPDVMDGQIAAVSIDDEATLKRVYHARDAVTLVAENPRYAPMVFREEDARNVRILGLAVAVYHGLV